MYLSLYIHQLMSAQQGKIACNYEWLYRLLRLDMYICKTLYVVFIIGLWRNVQNTYKTWLDNDRLYTNWDINQDIHLVAGDTIVYCPSDHGLSGKYYSSWEKFRYLQFFSQFNQVSVTHAYYVCQKGTM